MSTTYSDIIKAVEARAASLRSQHASALRKMPLPQVPGSSGTIKTWVERENLDAEAVQIAVLGSAKRWGRLAPRVVAGFRKYGDGSSESLSDHERVRFDVAIDVVDICHIGISMVSAIVGVCSLMYALGWMVALGAVVCADGHAFVLLGLVALRSDGKVHLSHLLPHRTAAIGILALLFTGIVFAFGQLYITSGGVVGPSVTECRDREQKCHLEVAANEAVTSPADAGYFSLVTIATVGYGDYAPASGSVARWYVMLEIASGLQLLILAFPLVVSRVANY